MKFLENKVSRDQSQDTGMAMVLLLLVLDIRMRREGILFTATALHVLNMTVPQIYKPVAFFWLGLSHLLGIISSKILLSILFFGVVTPVGILRRVFGKDPLNLRTFKAGQDTVMLERNHRFSDKDLERPY